MPAKTKYPDWVTEVLKMIYDRYCIKHNRTDCSTKWPDDIYREFARDFEQAQFYYHQFYPETANSPIYDLPERKDFDTILKNKDTLFKKKKK